MREVLGNRSLLILGVAESISNVGNWITLMALMALLIFRGEGGIAASSALMLAGLGPVLVAGPVAGWLSDRVDRRRLMISGQLLSALPVLALFFFQNGVVVYLLVALQALTFSVVMPARQAALPSLVSGAQLTRANAFLQQLSSFTKVGAPMLGGAIVAALGPSQALLLDLLTFVGAAGILRLLPPLPPVPQGEVAVGPEGGHPPAHSVWQSLLGSHDLKLLFASMFMAIIVIMGFDVLGSVYIRDVLLADERFFGLMVGLIGLGSLGAALWLMARGSGDTWRELWLGGLFLSVIPLLLCVATFAAPPVGRALALFGALIGGVGNGFVAVQVPTLLQQLSPPALLGRVGGLFQSTIVAGQLLTILSAPLLVPRWLSMGQIFGLSTMVLWGVVALILLHRRRGGTRAPAVRSAPELL